MYKKFIYLTLAAASVATASGAGFKTTAFPPAIPPGCDSQRDIMRAPLNQERKKGLKAFGFTTIDYNRSRSFCNYFQNEYMLEKLNSIASEEEVMASGIPDLYMVNAGAYNPDDGSYYAYKVKYFTIGITYSCQWLKVNPADGQWTVIAELDNHMHDNTYLYDMAYSIYDGEMWGLVQNSDGQIKSRVGIVDLADSSVSDFIQLPDYYFAIAFDYEGNAVGVRWKANSNGDIVGSCLDRFDKDFKVVSSTELLVDGAPWLGYFQHGLDFDYSTGDLLWAATDVRGNQAMVRINPDTGETEKFGAIGWNELMLGLHVPYETASDREAPARVSDLSFTIDPEGREAVTVNWTNPATRWNRQPLSDLESVTIRRDSRDSEPIAVIDAKGMEGRTMSFEDKGATQGIHTYYVTAVNAAGTGVPDSIEAFSGKDTPGPVQELKVSTFDDGRSVKVEWKAPVIGDSEGWFDSAITYDVTRLPDNKTVAEGVSALFVEDKDIEEAQFFSYQVTPSNAQGVGTPAVSEGILAGGSLKMPFATEFENNNEADRFTSFDTSGNKSVFIYTSDNTRPGKMAMMYTLGSQNNATLACPPLNVTQGKSYRVRWNFTTCRYGKSMDEMLHHIRITGGTAPRATSMKTLADYPELLSVKTPEKFEIITYFEAGETGDYYVGLNVMSEIPNLDSSMPWIYVTGFEIVEACDNDLEALELDAPAWVSATQPNKFKVAVRNNGATDLSGYKVEVGVSRLDGRFLPFAETGVVPTIKSHDTGVVEIWGYPKDGQGVQDLVARVTVDSDPTSGNNDTGMVEVLLFDGDAFNNSADEEYSHWTDSSLPMSAFYDYSASQTAYTPQMLGFTGEKNIITGLAWVYNSPIDIKFDNLKIWLAETGLETFDNKEWEDTDNVLVYDGPVSIEAGQEAWMRVPFEDKPFTLNSGNNLLVTVASYETANTGNTSFPLIFHIWNDFNANPGACDGLYHSLNYRGGAPFDFTQSCYLYNQLPVLHVATRNTTGICTPADNLMHGTVIHGRTASLSATAERVEVYDMNGRIILSCGVKGGSDLSLPMGPGLYILRVSDRQGNSEILKVSLR